MLRRMIDEVGTHAPRPHVPRPTSHVPRPMLPPCYRRRAIDVPRHHCLRRVRAATHHWQGTICRVTAMTIEWHSYVYPRLGRCGARRAVRAMRVGRQPVLARIATFNF